MPPCGSIEDRMQAIRVLLEWLRIQLLGFEVLVLHSQGWIESPWNIKLMKERLYAPSRSFMLTCLDRQAPIDCLAITPGIASNEGCDATIRSSAVPLAIRASGLSRRWIRLHEDASSTGRWFPYLTRLN